MSRKVTSVTDNGVLIGDNAIEVDVLTDIGILKEDRIADDGALSDLNSSEYYAVFNLALDHATVRNDGIGNLCVRAVGRGSGVTNLGEYGSVAALKELFSYLGLKKLHRGLEISGKIVDKRIEAVEAVSAEIGATYVLCDDIAEEAGVAVCRRVVEHRDEITAGDDHNIGADVERALDIGAVFSRIDDLVVLVERLRVVDCGKAWVLSLPFS